MSIAVKRATRDDLETLVPLFDAYRAFYLQDADPVAAGAFLDERLARGDSVIMLATTDKVAAGFIQMYPMFSSVRMCRIWILNDLYVDSSARQSGIGTALLQAAADFARSDGAAALQLATQKVNEPAKRLYERLSWTRETEFDHYYLDV